MGITQDPQMGWYVSTIRLAIFSGYIPYIGLKHRSYILYGTSNLRSGIPIEKTSYSGQIHVGLVAYAF